MIFQILHHSESHNFNTPYPTPNLQPTTVQGQLCLYNTLCVCACLCVHKTTVQVWLSLFFIRSHKWASDKYSKILLEVRQSNAAPDLSCTLRISAPLCLTLSSYWEIDTWNNKGYLLFFRELDVVVWVGVPPQ